MSFGYSIKEGFAGFGRTKLASATSTFSLFIAVLLAGFLARGGYALYTLAVDLTDEVQMEIFLAPISEERTQDFGDYLDEQPWVESIDFTSKEAASARFEQEFGEGFGSEALADLDFLPASFTLILTPDISIDEVQQQVKRLQEFQEVDDIAFNAALYQQLRSRVDQSLWVGLSVASVILIASIWLVFNTIRLTIYAKRDTIKAMKLVGATNAFIRRPFVIEGVLQGWIGSIVAFGVLDALFRWGVPLAIPQMGVLAWPLGAWYYLAAGMFLLGTLIGLLGSTMASHRFIRLA
ncbi:MAG: permease-like cell division protein FtsX [Bacteroidetes bacterium]|nr:permease-like cell division protein FtsX [Bacteroidota bacterium]